MNTFLKFILFISSVLLRLTRYVFFKKTIVGTGALLDTRPVEKKEKDYSAHEVYTTANAVTWVEKSESTWRRFPVQNQNGSGSCVAQTMKKILGVMYWLKTGKFLAFSATHVYQRRSNKPSGGMIGMEAFDIAMKGVTLETFVPSEVMTDSQMDTAIVEEYMAEVGNVFKIGGHIGLPLLDIESVASAIETTKKAVMVWFYFTGAEWSQRVPVVMVNLRYPGDQCCMAHSVAATDFTLYKGKKALIIEDSAHFGGLSERIITEDFFSKRNFFSRYPMNFTFGGPSEETSPAKPKYTFSKQLDFIPLDAQGNISDTAKNASQLADVKALQNILKYEGIFPTNIESTGYYGSITAKYVLVFQKKYAVDTDSALNELAGKSIGPKTRAKLNELYG